MERWRGWLPPGLAVVLTLVMLGPALLPGNVLTYDMVWVPDLALRSDFFGLGTALPRAVPSDAVVALLDEVVPGVVLQKLVLVGALVAGGVGAQRLLGDVPVVARAAAVVVYVWSPFVVERLVIGHWPLLVAHAVLPWTILSLRSWRGGDASRGWWVLLPLAALSPSGGVAATVVAIVVGGGRLPLRRWFELCAIVIAANAPWVVAGLLHLEVAYSDPRGAAVFALSDEGLLPGPLAALGLGGIWNADVVPTSRTGPLAVVALVVLLGLAAFGVRRGVDGLGRLAVLWLVGYAAAVTTWAAPGLVAWLAETVPGGGLLRDGGRALVLCLPLLAVLVGRGVNEVGQLIAVRWQRAVVVWCLALAPVAVMPDAGGGVSGRLSATSFPASYERARTVVGARGDVLVLPFTSYRAPEWNGDRPVLDPLGRYLRPNVVVNDELFVDGEPVRGEDPRAAAVARALAEPEPTPALTALGIEIVVVDATAPGEVPDVVGRELLSGDVRVVEIATSASRDDREPGVLPVALAWAAYATLVTAGLVRVVVAVSRRRLLHPGALP